MSGVAPCPACGSNTVAVKLIGGLCYEHWKNPKAKIDRSDSREKQKDDNKAAKTLDQWFKLQLAQCPKNCENCGKPIRMPEGMQKAKVAHILPKRKSQFPTVATHLVNRWFACLDCHTLYDSSWDKAAKMPIATICKERVAEFYHLLTDKEKGKLPEWIKPTEKGFSVSRLKK